MAALRTRALPGSIGPNRPDRHSRLSRHRARALFSYRVDSDLRVRRRLCITDLIVAHLPGADIDAAVAATARRVSAELGCHAITIEQPFYPDTRERIGCPTVQALKTRTRRAPL
jgi:hypothetical protein